MVVDDHPMWRQTLRKVLEESGVGTVVCEARDGEEAIRLVTRARPDLVVMDIHLPVMDGAHTTREVLRLVPSAKVLVLSATDDRERVLDAVEAGASGYLLKTAEPSEVVDAIRRVHRGEPVFPAELAAVIFGKLRGGASPRQERVRVVVADSSGLFREGLVRILGEAGFAVVAGVGDAHALLSATATSTVDVIVTDARLPGEAALMETLRKAHPDVAVVVLAQDVEADVAASLLTGASAGVGYLLKDRVSDVEQLADSIRRVSRGGSVVDPEVALRMVRPAKPRDVLEALTERERDVLALMAEGRSNQAICERLFLSPKAVEAHTRNIFMKLGLERAPDDNNRVLAVITYLRSL